MAMWQIGPVEAEPETTLCRWQVIQATYANGDEPCTLHLVGRNTASWSGRVSTGVVELDVAAQRARTQSGRVYELDGPPGIDAEAAYVWELWADVNGVFSWKDVTGELFPGCRQSPEPSGPAPGPLQ
jgi:hypothetical protein